jgi:hypothetical protein
LDTRAKDPILAVFSKAALLSRGWVDPNPIASTKIFTDMVERVMTGTLTTDRAIFEAQAELQNLMAPSN